MYRDAAPRADDAPRELVYTPNERQGTPPGLAALQVIAVPFVVGVVVTLISTPTLGIVAIVATAVLMVWQAKRPSSLGLILQVENGELAVTPRGSKKPLARMRLDALADVVLETKTIRPVLDGPSAIPAMRFAEGRVGGDVDTARIALVDADGASVLLGESYLSHMEAIEWFGKVRVFLRRHGWVPITEQEQAEPDSEDPA